LKFISTLLTIAAADVWAPLIGE